MAGFLYKGILLQQHKEPALSRDLREFLNADTIGVLMISSQSRATRTLSTNVMAGRFLKSWRNSAPL